MARRQRATPGHEPLRVAGQQRLGTFAAALVCGAASAWRFAYSLGYVDQNDTRGCQALRAHFGLIVLQSAAALLAAAVLVSLGARETPDFVRRRGAWLVVAGCAAIFAAIFLRPHLGEIGSCES